MTIHRTLTLSAALAAATVLAAGAVAANTGTGHKAAPATQTTCDSLSSQFDTAWSSHENDKNAKQAKSDRDAGAKSCQDGKYSQGVHQLHQALHELGIKSAASK